MASEDQSSGLGFHLILRGGEYMSLEESMVDVDGKTRMAKRRLG